MTTKAIRNKQHKVRALFLAVPIALYSGLSHSEEGVFTGTIKLACDAILCLSDPAGDSLAECQPGLDAYYGIWHRKTYKRRNRRRNFLNQCPVVMEPGMSEKVDEIVNTHL